MYNLKIKRSTPYPILLIEVGLSPIESLTMARLLLYKHKINNMGDHRLPKLAFNTIQNQLRLKQGWYKDTRDWLNHWEINENVHCKILIRLKILLLLSLKRTCGVRKN